MIHFSKYQGAGNNFILVDDRCLQFSIHTGFIQKLCNRHFGIGSDGLILLQPNFRMRIFNSDGSEAASCGNGIRCLVRFLKDLGFPQQNFSIHVGKRIVEAYLLGKKISVDMGEAKNIRLHIQLPQIGQVHFADTGVPHVVYFVENINRSDFLQIAPSLRQDMQANASFAAIQPDQSIHVRTFERGIERETPSCGTGACAVALLAKKVFFIKGPIKILYPGGDLEIECEGDRVKMIGEAEKIFEGIFYSVFKNASQEEDT